MIFKGSEYICEKRKETKTVWKCAMYSRVKCKARIHTYGKTLKIVHEEHNHEPLISKEQSETLVPFTVSIIKQLND